MQRVINGITFVVISPSKMFIAGYPKATLEYNGYFWRVMDGDAYGSRDQAISEMRRSLIELGRTDIVAQ